MAKEGFEVKGLIGQGAFGKVFLMEDKEDGTKLALKLIQIEGRNPKEIFQTIQEVKLLAVLKHDYILRYVHAQEEDGSLMILTEYCSNGDLDGYLKEHQGEVMDERRLVEWIRQITSALKYLHGFDPKIIHRDLKNANIFLNENWDTKLGDFGIARVVQSAADLVMTQCGTPMYMSPEIFAGIPYSDKTDIYSLGIMMYEMAHMDKPAILPQMILFKIVHGSLPTMPTTYSDGVNTLLGKMMQKQPKDRPSADEILSYDLFKTSKKPPPIPPRSVSKEDEVDEDYEEDEFDMNTLLGTLTQLRTQQDCHGGGAAFMMHAAVGMSDTTGAIDGGYEPPADDDNNNPVMHLVKRTLAGMGHQDVVEMRGRSTLDRQVQMLKMYCMQCLDNNATLFKQACKALDSDHDEDEIEETLIRILGHEKYGLCGVQLLHYKNFTFNLRS